MTIVILLENGTLEIAKSREINYSPKVGFPNYPQAIQRHRALDPFPGQLRYFETRYRKTNLAENRRS